jgi:hypothetical protein
MFGKNIQFFPIGVKNVSSLWPVSKIAHDGFVFKLEKLLLHINIYDFTRGKNTKIYPINLTKPCTGKNDHYQFLQVQK